MVVDDSELCKAGALVIGAALVPFLLQLPRRTARLFMAAGGIYLSGAVGLEILGNSMSLQSLKNTLGYSMQTLAEEGLEMLGVVLFLYALLDYMRGDGEVVNASLEIP